VVAAVTRAAPHVPEATRCLARALTGWLMMRRRNEVAIVRLGVNRAGAKAFAAHAWLECNGLPVNRRRKLLRISCRSPRPHEFRGDLGAYAPPRRRTVSRG